MERKVEKRKEKKLRKEEIIALSVFEKAGKMINIFFGGWPADGWMGTEAVLKDCLIQSKRR